MYASGSMSTRVVTTVATLTFLSAGAGLSLSELVPPAGNFRATATPNREEDPLAFVRIGQEYIDKECRGAQVLVLKKLLQRLGYKTSPNDLYDAGTRTAVIAFQKACKLQPDGIVGKQTLARIEASLTNVAVDKADPLMEVRKQLKLLKLEDKGQDVRCIQKLLNAVQPESTVRLAEDGYFSALMVEAVKTFQRQNEPGQPVDGLVRKRTLEALERVAANKSVTLSGLVQKAKETLLPLSANTTPATEATFTHSIKLLQRFEGGLSKDSADRGNRGGNATLCGITQMAYDAWLLRSGKQSTPVAELLNRSVYERERIIASFYREEYWIPSRCPGLPPQGKAMPDCIALVHMDTVVNMGLMGGARLLQAGLEQYGIVVDGNIGPKTMNAIAQTDAVSLTRRYLNLREERYKVLAEVGSNKKFLNGWINRVNALRRETGINPEAPILAVIEGGVERIEYGSPAADRQAIEAFQRERGLKVTGELDVETFRALKTKK